MNKKLFALIACLSITVGLTSCGKKDNKPTSESQSQTSSQQSQDPIENDSGLPAISTYYDEPSVQIHYQRYEGSYKEWGLWLWAEGLEGNEYEFNYADDYGVIAYYPLSQFANAHSLGFIVKKLFSVAGDGVWEKDYSLDRFMDIDMLQLDEHQSYHVYLRNGKAGTFTDKERQNEMNAVTKCEFSNPKKIEINTNNPLSEAKIYKNNVEVTDATYKFATGNTTVYISLAADADVSDIYQAYVKFENNVDCRKGVSIRNLYDASFGTKYNYDGELGAIYSAASTTFKVWSPVSQRIELRIYNSGTPLRYAEKDPSATDTFTAYEMTKDSKGVFSYTVTGDLEGKYYTYFVVNSSNPEGKEIVDPYAYSAGVSGLRGMVVDFSKTNPSNWDSVNYFDYDRKELTVYETHIAELTCSDTWNGPAAKQKLYTGFYETGTSYTQGATTVSTGFDHIKELGVNAVQIIPFFDQANDELNMSFNWGYNPLNYNVLEGGYSSNPFDGYQRIIEFKELVKAYHDAGISIIMDVVYNHVNGLTGSSFDVLMPYYYFRYTNTGAPSNGSGCGNETASDKYMFRKFMIDSTSFWTREYKLGGFRFDLMGLHDVETMNMLVAANKEINPHAVIYGEPWTGGDSALPEGYTAATQTNASQYVGFGQFNDRLRDSMIKSGMNLPGNKGWVTQDQYPVDPTEILYGLSGRTGNSTDDPDKSIAYATCHDNYTLHDRCVVAGIRDEAKIEKINKLANSIVFASQGTAFMLAGEEMLRTKIVYDVDGNPVYAKDEDGNSLDYYDVSGNSYSSSYKTNQLDYSWKIAHPEMFAYYKKLIAMKQKVSGLHLAKAAVDASKVKLSEDKDLIHVTFNDGDTVYEAYFANGVKQHQVDITGYSLYADSLNKTISGTSHTLDPYEVLIIYK